MFIVFLAFKQFAPLKYFFWLRSWSTGQDVCHWTTEVVNSELWFDMKSAWLIVKPIKRSSFAEIG